MKADISIRIPVYNQPDKLYHCLKSIESQTVSPSEIILIDDCSYVDYISTIEQFEHLPLNYVRNKNNLGALPNMLNALYLPTRCDYILVFHEDDLMHPKFIEASIKAVSKNNQAKFVCSTIGFFSDYKLVKYDQILDFEVRKLNVEEYILEILKGKTIGFGSIVYNKRFLKKTEFDFDTFAVLGDRPFLIEIINDGNVIFIDNDLSVAYSHEFDDNRWHSLSHNHIYNLYEYYRSKITNSYNKENINLIKSGFTKGIFDNYDLLPNSNKIWKLFYLYYAWKRNLLSVKYLVLLNRRIRKFIEKIIK